MHNATGGNVHDEHAKTRARAHTRTHTESKDAYYFPQIGMNAAGTHTLHTHTHTHTLAHTHTLSPIPTRTHTRSQHTHTLSHIHADAQTRTRSLTYTQTCAHALSHMGRYVSVLLNFFGLFILLLNSGQFAQHGSYLGIITRQQHHSEGRAVP